ALDEMEQSFVIESLNPHSRHGQRRFNSDQERRKFGHEPIVLAARPLYAFSRGKAPGSAQPLFPFMAGLRLINNGIPIEHRVQLVIEKFAGGFFFFPSTATLFVDRSENYI